MSGADLIAAERQRQIDVEGYALEHDVAHADGSLALAACSYAMLPHWRKFTTRQVPRTWPWGSSAWKPTPDDRVRELVKAGALIAAEIDRLQATS